MDTQFVKTTIEDLLAKLAVPGTVEVIDDEETHMTIFQVQTDDAQILIGHHGETLSAFSHIVKKMSDKHDDTDEKTSFIVDVNGYQKRRIMELKDKANILAERAKYFKSSVEMDPMSPYERMIVHSIFSENSNLETESTGRGFERRVVIRYVGE